MLFDRQRYVGPRPFELTLPKPPEEYMNIIRYLQQRPLLEEDVLEELIEEQWA